MKIKREYFDLDQDDLEEDNNEEDNNKSSKESKGKRGLALKQLKRKAGELTKRARLAQIKKQRAATRSNAVMRLLQRRDERKSMAEKRIKVDAKVKTEKDDLRVYDCEEDAEEVEKKAGVDQAKQNNEFREKALRCDVPSCLYVAQKMIGLANHQRSHKHKEKVCAQCGAQFKNQRGLSNHVSRIHKNSGVTCSKEAQTSTKKSTPSKTPIKQTNMLTFSLTSLGSLQN